jgi:hypothetical protein
MSDKLEAALSTVFPVSKQETQIKQELCRLDNLMA